MIRHTKFRHLIPAGTRFDFLGVSRRIGVLSLLLLLASVGVLLFNLAVRGSLLNWTIDFRGGTEIIFSARDAETGAPAPLDVGEVRDALAAAGHGEDEVSSMAWAETVGGAEREIEGTVVRTTQYGAVGPEVAARVEQLIRERFGAAESALSLRWSGDRLQIRAPTPITSAELAPIFEQAGLELVPGGEPATQTATGEYNLELAVAGLDREIERILERAFPDRDIRVEQSYAVGPRASEDLFRRGLAAIVYAMAFIMLYLAVRFDIRYAPGAIKATVHDAVIVIGVLGATWTPVSLATLAALLTVIGYSVNDTAIVFDRIRENLKLYKNEQLEALVNRSLNEVLGRSLLTSLFVFSVTLVMNILGDGVLANFAFVLNVGVVIGAASTLFLSAPVFVWISRRFYSGSRPGRPPRPSSPAESTTLP